MHILHVIEGLREEDGGPVVSLRNLIATTSYKVSHSVLYQRASKEILSSFDANASLLPMSKESIESALSQANLVHVHGMWSVPQIRVAHQAFTKGIPYVVSPRGMLEPWSLQQGRFKKALFMKAFGKKFLSQAIVVHATAEMEADHLPEYVQKEKIRVIPNVVEGVIHPEESRKFEDGIRALFLSRIHPKKGLFDLVPAWGKASEGTAHRLCIVGPGDEQDVLHLKDKLEKLTEPSGIEFCGPAYGDEKFKRMASANVFLLPSYSENYGNVVPEALSAGLPVLTTTGMPWAWLVEEGCGWEIEPGLESLNPFLEKLFQMSSDELSRMSQKARDVFQSKLSPEVLGKRYVTLYHEIIS